MKTKKMLALLLTCCFIFSVTSATAMAMEINTEVTQEKTSEVVFRSTDNEYFHNSSSDEIETFTITKSTSYFIYNTGSFGTTDPVFIKFTNTATGASCTHPIYGATLNRKIYCNLTAGVYTINFLNDKEAVGYLHIVFYN